MDKGSFLTVILIPSSAVVCMIVSFLTVILLDPKDLALVPRLESLQPRPFCAIIMPTVILLVYVNACLCQLGLACSQLVCGNATMQLGQCLGTYGHSGTRVNVQRSSQSYSSNRRVRIVERCVVSLCVGVTKGYLCRRWQCKIRSLQRRATVPDISWYCHCSCTCCTVELFS